MPFRATFDCLWCGTAWSTRGADDLEGWAQLCPDCLGKAGTNPFLRIRLRTAIAERGAGGGSASVSTPRTSAPSAVAVSPAPAAAPTAAEAVPAHAPAPPMLATAPDTDAMVAYYEARAPEYDDWYQRRGRYERGPIHDTAWHAELDAAGRWLDALPISGRIVELAAGTGWWSPLLAGKGELTLYDAAPATLDRARERLVAHRLRAHLHVRDAWAPPEGDPADAVFTGFWVSHVERARLAGFLSLVAGWLKPRGRYALIDSLPDPASGAADHPMPGDDRSVRRLDDGREFEIVKVYHPPDELAAALEAAGFHDVEVTTTGRFFVLATAVR